MFKRGGKVVTEKYVNIYKQIEEVDAAKAKRKMQMRLIYGGSFVVSVVILASLFLPPDKITALTELFDTILKYLPWG